ncbi:hypothetical protein IQ277_35190 [Nostocales cyanobacterium LEGE 12452]|nr:hypothetical protein [Nostocales cyanobacterium LEGE 12452]
MGQDAIHRVSTTGVFVSLFFQIGIMWLFVWAGSKSNPWLISGAIAAMLSFSTRDYAIA